MTFNNQTPPGLGSESVHPTGEGMSQAYGLIFMMLMSEE
jgi:hypothetical protein